ncbi:D-alanyl-D-alanine carboxypeptidase / D-alanyl-D-alanine-endopeptidase (penicillin-binding protein 4) [Actinopolyspora xinjiangensis]|uniref:D-alanyl-D-alanine carboxypeptidase / D-alanyl-D-alanine-endopeptidase (Penicillin-binding protein 4) n=1 Tax=Actinopolyspora xinjiangensis TaxID=405564 RepID=A0A1H0SMS1_9ACTN|nr:D-alanyl-D-alanine carboxypeptidase/D-alanyl-D-alanine-endopeptidase [Actinopolyspora xinjiangensis]SDP43020.1 D-alanyl-D-alanine carboxypeptidase / D-alanyl-D-alanine-endopeptidase (penicillin-binding protein 4) [Actinopolyspora xinjiangensis]
MRRALVLLVGFTVLLAVPGAASPVGSTRSSLRADLDRILSDSRLEGASVGVVVRDPATDRILYRRSPHRRLVPASNAKLFTSVAALEALGPDFRFRTGVLTTGMRRGGVLLGDLYLRGGGDPTMLASDYRRLADRIADAGIRVVRGDVLADDSHFDDRGLANGWMAIDEPYYYAAPVSALTVAPNTDYDAGSVVVRVRPTRRGQPVRVSSHPETDAVEIVNRARTLAPGATARLSVRRAHGTDRVIVSGGVPAGSGTRRVFSSVPDPTAYALDVFRRALVERGITFEGVGEAVTPERARVLAEHRSMPLRRMLVPFLKLSNNGHAEALVKAMGRVVRGEGNWQAGLRVVRNRMAALGIEPGDYRLVDGSGLSTLDSLAPAQLAELLDVARERPWFETWKRALPLAGASDRMTGGTLRGRMRGTPAEGNVSAKTGSMTGVSALSGYVRTRTDRQLVFSVVFNGFLAAPPREVQDAVVVRLARHGAGAEGAPPDPDGRGRSSVEVADTPSTPPDEAMFECSWSKSC